QRLAGEILHHRVCLVLVDDDLVDADDVRVMQAARDRGLGPDQLTQAADAPRLPVAGLLEAHVLDRHPLGVILADGAIHRGGRTLADLLDDVETTDACGDVTHGFHGLAPSAREFPLAYTALGSDAALRTFSRLHLKSRPAPPVARGSLNNPEWQQCRIRSRTRTPSNRRRCPNTTAPPRPSRRPEPRPISS